MRILLIHQYFLEENDAGGSRWNEMTKFWSENGHDITVVAGMMHANGSEKSPEYKGKWFVRKKHNNVNVLRCHVSEAYNKGFLGRLWGYFSFMFSSMWGGMFKVKGKYDVIIVTSPPLFVGLSGVLIASLKRLPLVFEVRDLWPESAIDTGVLTNKFIIRMAYAVERLIYRKAKMINVLTPAFRETLINQKGIRPEKIIQISNAADFTLSEELLATFDKVNFRKQLGVEDKFVITYVGAHGVANHLQQVLEAADLLRDTNVLFLLIGQGMEKQKLIDQAQKMELKNVRFIDPVPKAEVFKYILASDMGTSVLQRNDTFKTVYSNKTFDYMSCKKPILMAIDGVSRKLVEDAEAGVFVEPERAEDFVAKINIYRNNPELLQLHGENGYSYAKQNFDRFELANRYIDAIDLINRKR